MTQPEGRLHSIYRYPVKGLSPERLERASLLAGCTLANDRRYAIENGPSGFDPAAPRHQPKQRYLMLMRNAALARLRTRYRDDTRTLEIDADADGRISGDLLSAQGRAEIEAFLARLFPDDLRGPPKILQADGFSFSDVARKVVSIINLASVAELETMLDRPVHPLRFRGNLYVTGWPAWHEFDLLGRDIAIGPAARVRIVKRIVRCAATNVDPDTAMRDLDIPGTLMRRLGHADCGIYGEIIADGDIVDGDALVRG